MKQVLIDNICYSLDSATCTATVFPKKYAGDIVIPATVAYDAISYRVTNIGAHAFLGCVKLTSITIPSKLISIGRYAFAFSRLISITIPNGVMSIGEGAFYGSGLTSIIIPDGVTSIGEFAFEDCESLMSITLPASIEEIGWAIVGRHYDNQQTIVYVPQGMTEKFCKMGLERWRKQIVEISPHDDKDGK